MEPIKVVGSNETYVQKFRLYGISTTFKFNPAPSGVTEIDWLKRGFGSIVEKAKAEAKDGDYLGFTLTSLNLRSKEPGYIAFTPFAEINNDVIWEIFGGIVQSNQDSITSSDTFFVKCTRVNVPVGSGKKIASLFYNTFEEECKGRNGIVQIKNIDNLCLPRALVVAKAHVKRDPQYKLIRMDRKRRQETKARKLMAKARVEIPSEGAGICELEKFQTHLKKYKITVYNYDKKGRDIYFSGNNPEANFKINLLFHEGHFNVITSLTSAFTCGYYCEDCHIPYNTKGEHRCKNICSSCQSISPPCRMENNGIECPNCNIRFKNQQCFSAHQGRRCEAVKKCPDCDRLFFPKKRKSQHMCEEVFCKICNDFFPENHQCYMSTDNKIPPKKDFLFIFFDLETRQDEKMPYNPESNVHVVNLCVSQQYCWECIDSEEECSTCPLAPQVFNEDPLANFMEYVMNIRKRFKNVCVMAHNGQGFDFQFVLKYLLHHTKFTPTIIPRGSKIMLMEVANVRFVDSLNFFPMPLSALPKAFELGPEKKKGYFPHLFNTSANQNYVGPMPEKIFYCPDSMFDKNNKQFEKWYNEQVSRNYTFDFKKEILEYCISDVDILAQACIKFRALFLKECNVDPFLETVTIASACNLAFRRNFLKPNTIGLLPKRGYRLVDNQSKKALQWLTLEEEKRKVRIQHAGRGKEVKVSGMKVDGFDEQRIYEFQGCYYHGCKRCFPYKREEPLREDPFDTLDQRYERTMNKVTKLRERGYEVIEMWECDFDETVKKEKLDHLESLPVLNSLPLNPREAFFGGRTDCTKMYYKCAEGETIKYVDVCSLYPWVCKYGKYPLGHPTLYIGHEECIARGMNAEGLLKCKVLPPNDLYHPVLPLKCHNKLMFPLCKTCVDGLISSNCTHNEDERAFVGTWMMDEIRKAIEKGYTIVECYELWEYKVATYETGGLFTDFINKFVKMKQEASGLPSWCNSSEDIQEYVQAYFEFEQVHLDPQNIHRNEGMRSLSKLMLNSFWGKFGQRENLQKVLITRSSQEFFKLMTSPEIQVNTIHDISEDVLLVNWNYLQEVGDFLRTTNVVLAAFTTAQARIKLYEYLDSLGTRVLYHDTDSVIYIQRPGLYEVPTGDYLGQMTDELASDYGPGSYITEFVSGGPKTYAYRVFSTNKNELMEVCKVKGLTLNLKTSEKLNFETLKRMVLNEESETPLKIVESRIRCNRDKNVLTVEESKTFKITGAKRVRDEEFDTLPYGFCKRPRQN